MRKEERGKRRQQRKKRKERAEMLMEALWKHGWRTKISVGTSCMPGSRGEGGRERGEEEGRLD